MSIRSKVLVIEDDPASGRMLRALFQSEGCEVLLAATGRLGIEMAAKEPALGAVFLDLGLPDMGGMDVLSALRASNAEVPVVVLTGDTELPTAIKAIQLGALNYFTKPINTDQIVAVLRQALERRAMRAELEELKGQLVEGHGLARQMGPAPHHRARATRRRLGLQSSGPRWDRRACSHPWCCMACWCSSP